MYHIVSVNTIGDPAATNLVTNGGLETNATGWSATGTNTVARSTAQAKFGTGSAIHTKGVTAGDLAFGRHEFDGTSTAATVVSVWAYVPSTYTGTQLRLESGKTFVETFNSNVDMTKTDQWQLVTLVYTPTQTGTYFIEFVERGTVGAAAEVFYTDGHQAEKSSVATPYIETDGSTISRVAFNQQRPVRIGHLQ